MVKTRLDRVQLKQLKIQANLEDFRIRARMRTVDFPLKYPHISLNRLSGETIRKFTARPVIPAAASADRVAQPAVLVEGFNLSSDSARITIPDPPAVFRLCSWCGGWNVPSQHEFGAVKFGLTTCSNSSCKDQMFIGKFFFEHFYSRYSLYLCCAYFLDFGERKIMLVRLFCLSFACSSMGF